MGKHNQASKEHVKAVLLGSIPQHTHADIQRDCHLDHFLSSE